MKRFVSGLLLVSTQALMFLVLATDRTSWEQNRFIGSMLPVMLIITDLNATRFSFQEIRGQKFRLTVYGLSLLLFAVHLLSFLNVISIQSAIPPRFPGLRRGVSAVLGLSFFPLMLVNIFYLIRDTDRRGHGRPL